MWQAHTGLCSVTMHPALLLQQLLLPGWMLVEQPALHSHLLFLLDNAVNGLHLHSRLAHALTLPALPLRTLQPQIAAPATRWPATYQALFMPAQCAPTAV